MFAVFLTNLINFQITAFFRNLCRDSESLSRIYPTEDSFLKRIIVFRNTSDTECFQNDRIVMSAQQFKNICLYFWRQLQNKDTVVQPLVRYHICLSGCWCNVVTDDPVIMDHGKKWKVHTFKSVKTSCSLFSCAGSGNYFSIKYNRNITGVIVQCIENTLVNIDLGIRIWVAHWFL